MREFLWVNSGPYFSAYEKNQSARSLKSAEVEDAGRDGWKWRVLRPGHRRVLVQANLCMVDGWFWNSTGVLLLRLTW